MYISLTAMFFRINLFFRFSCTSTTFQKQVSNKKYVDVNDDFYNNF